ncbi:two-component system, chemotaxis family, response regulator CheY [Lachnospiraceae bacterium KH1T2]|nr:two-component system, chemotaxis family, response regulator CheY [Lachnospiraceae bacterium KH1T2]
MRKRILLADDTKLMRDMLRAALDSEKFQIAGEAKDGEQAVAMFKDLKPDLVILDINMPKLNGIDALSEMIEYDPKAKIVMCSDQKFENMIVLALKRGACDFIVKPFKNEDVMRAMKQVFKDL